MASCPFGCLGMGLKHSAQVVVDDEETVVVVDDEADRSGAKRLRGTSGDGARPAPCSAVEDCKRACMADQQAQVQWTCDLCTFINDGNGPSCEACDGARPNQGGDSSTPGRWQCEHCTMHNGEGAHHCQMCHKTRGVPRSVEVVELLDDDDLYILEGTGSRLPGNHASQLPCSSSSRQMRTSDYVLDTCGCRWDREDLAAILARLVLPAHLGHLLACLVCPNTSCRRPLSRTDLCNLVSLGNLQKMDIAVYMAALREAHASNGAAALGPIGGHAGGQVRRCLELCRAIQTLHSLQTAGAGAPAMSVAATSRPAAGRGTAKSSGTGYASYEVLGKKDGNAQATAAAAARQQKTDQEMTAALAAIRALLSEQQARPGVAHPLGVCALVQAPVLAASLRRLLQNGSLLDIGLRRPLYLELSQLLRKLAAHVELLPALQRPADFDEALALARGAPVQAARPGPRRAPPAGAQAQEEAAAPSVMHALTALNTQCAVFQRCAQQLAGGGDDADMDALTIALELSATYEQLSESVALVQTSMPGPQHAAAPGPLGANGLHSPRQPALAHGSDRGSAQAAAEEPAALHQRYVGVLEPLRFRDADLVGAGAFYFRDAASKAKTGGSAWLRRIAQEQSALATALPCTWNSSVFLAVDSSRVDVLRALITGPEGTPYQNGCFLFDVWLPPEYPNKPPKVQFLTTGGGRVRFNPNLYNCGKVCLSLLGTWSGPGWVPGESTILQVLISIQSMILVADPYFNEPGYDSMRGLKPGYGAKESQLYSTKIQGYTACHAILNALQKPNAAFADVIREHFRWKKGQILAQCAAWKTDPGTSRAIAAELAKL